MLPLSLARKLMSGVGLLAALVALLALAPTTSTVTSLAQSTASPAPGDATPAALASLIAPYPAGVSLAALAVTTLTSTPANPAVMSVDRYSLAGDDRLTGAAAGPRLIVVENGALLATDESGAATRYEVGASLLIPAAQPMTLEAATGQPVVWLQASIFPTGTDQRETATPVAAPTRLLSGSERLPRGESTLALVRFTLEAGADTGPRVFSGPVGFAVEAGTLTVVDLGGAPARVERGGALVAPAFTQHVIRNPGPEAATGVAFAVFPVSPALAGAPAATATPATDVSATATVAALLSVDATREAAAQTQAAGGVTAIAGAQATTAALAVDSIRLATDFATLTARSVGAEATIGSLAPTTAAAAAALTRTASDATAAQSTVAALAAAATAAGGDVATIAAQGTSAAGEVRQAENRVADAGATNAAQAILLQQAVSTATVQAQQGAAIQGTLAAALTAVTGNTAGLAGAEATRSAELAGAGATVTAQAGELSAIAAATAPVIDTDFVSVEIDQDVSGIFTEDLAARQTVVDQARAQLAPQIAAGCQVGLVLAFGFAPSPDVDTGTGLADAIIEVLLEEVPELFGNAATESFVNFRQPYGGAELRVYFASGCDVSTPTVAGTTPSSPPIVPVGE